MTTKFYATAVDRELGTEFDIEFESLDRPANIANALRTVLNVDTRETLNDPTWDVRVIYMSRKPTHYEAIIRNGNWIADVCITRAPI